MSVISALPAALYVLAQSSVQERVSQFGLAAAGFGLFLGALDLIGVQLASFLPSEVEVHGAVATMLPIRFAVLKTTVVMLRLFAWGTTRTSDGRSIGVRTWRALGWIVLVVSVLFIFVFVPSSIAFFIWAVGLTVTCALERGDPPKQSDMDASIAQDRS